MSEIRIDDINRRHETDAAGEIALAEQLYHSRIRDIARQINEHERVRIILLAGPSGSGKTTTANLLADALEAIGEESIVVSLDDFYRDSTDPDYPKTESGERDFECPESLHLEQIRHTLMKIAEGEAFCLPKYDFKLGRRSELTLHAPMPSGCVIVEGLHALNPAIYEGLPADSLLRLFVSVSTNVNNNEGERLISGRKIRFVRRLVRDSIYRASDARRTLSMWQDVLAAEDVYLYPYKADADLAFDTFHPFELGVMKPYAERLLTEELSAESEYVGIVRSALAAVCVIDESLVPENSLIREFIAGGVYHHIY